jgi:hypothetical protein
MSSSAAVDLEQPAKGAPLVTNLFFFGALLTTAVPRLTPFVLPLLCLVLIGKALWRGTDWRELIKPNTALVALIAVAFYAALSAIWAANPKFAIGKGVLLFAATLLTFATVEATGRLTDEEVRRAAIGFVAGALCGAVFVIVELLTDGAMTRFAMNSISAFKPEKAKHVAMSRGFVKRINLSEFNQHVGMLSFLLWPGLLALRGIATGRRRILLTILFFLAASFPIVISEHDSSQIGLGAALIVFALALKWPGQVVRGLALAWCLGFVLVLPLDFLVFKAGLHQADWLPTSARARIIIWEYTAEQVLKRPLLGIGADSTATVKDEQTTPAEKPPGFVFRRTTGQHSHDIFLQSWYELGLFGAILVAIAGAAMVLRIPLLSKQAQPFAAATFTTFAAIAAFAWGMWQIWLICAVALIPIYLALAACSLRLRTNQTS